MSNPFQCNEWLNNDIDIEPQSCDNVYGASYCVKHIGRFEGRIQSKILSYRYITTGREKLINTYFLFKTNN